MEGWFFAAATVYPRGMPLNVNLGAGALDLI
jgi:hypothetical protein